MTLQERIDLLVKLGNYLQENDEEWQNVKQKANHNNQWFIPEFIENSTSNIVHQFLQRDKLEQWTAHYHVPQNNSNPRKVGLVMAGNIPLVGFHDMLCIFITGHEQLIKPSSKDDILIKHLVKKLVQFDVAVTNYINFAEQLTGCQVYIATGGNNTGRYFDYYFGRFPNIIRKNRTSVAVLNGNETAEELAALADDIQLYFGLGCRNVTKLYVPEGYNFELLLNALRKYDHFMEYHKYRHNYDYQLALLMMGSKFYMTNQSVLLSENSSIFSAVSQVHFEYYKEPEEVAASIIGHADVQCIVGKSYLPLGKAQQPTLTDYADGVDTINFLLTLS